MPDDPLSVGLLALRGCVADAGAYARQIAARGGAWYRAPARFAIDPYGDLEVFAVRMPEGAILEFVSRCR